MSGAARIFEPGQPVHWTMLNADHSLTRAITDYRARAPLTPRQVELIRRYVLQWINAVTWDEKLMDAESRESLHILRLRAVILHDVVDCHRWQLAARQLGVDPFTDTF